MSLFMDHCLQPELLLSETFRLWKSERVARAEL